MSTLQEKNKAVVQKYFEEYWGKGNVSIVDEVCADNFVIDYPMHGPRHGKEAAKKMLLEFREVRKPDISYRCRRNMASYLMLSRRFQIFPSTPTSSL